MPALHVALTMEMAQRSENDITPGVIGVNNLLR
jgi:hypothetical protein